MTWAPDYITTQDLNDYTRVDDTVDDVQVQVAVTASSRAVDDYCNRQFGIVASAEARTYTAEWNFRRCLWIISIDDLMSPAVTGLVVMLGSDAVTDYTLEPRNAAQEGMPYTRLVINSTSQVKPSRSTDEFTLTARWGWNAFPVPVVQASLLQGSRFLARRDSPYGIAGSPDAGSEMRLLARLDPDVKTALGSRYVRKRRVM